jgi:hypothetical protein
MESSTPERPIHSSLISPIQSNGLGPVFPNLLPVAHKVMESQAHNLKQNQPGVRDMSEGPAFLSGFSIAIAFLAVMGNSFLGSQTSSISKAFVPLIS